MNMLYKHLPVRNEFVAELGEILAPHFKDQTGVSGLIDQSTKDHWGAAVLLTRDMARSILCGFLDEQLDWFILPNISSLGGCDTLLGRLILRNEVASGRSYGPEADELLIEFATAFLSLVFRGRANVSYFEPDSENIPLFKQLKTKIKDQVVRSDFYFDFAEYDQWVNGGCKTAKFGIDYEVATTKRGNFTERSRGFVAVFMLSPNDPSSRPEPPPDWVAKARFPSFEPYSSGRLG